MNEDLHAICLSNEPGPSAEVAAALTQLPGFTVRVREADYQSGLRDLRQPQLAIVILGTEPAPGLTVVEEIHRSSPSTRVLALSNDDNPQLLIKAMRAGADELLRLPVTPTDLLKVCIKMSETRRSEPGQTGPRGEIWAAHSPKGGVGVTTVVANLAFALRAARRDVALVDLSGGDLAVFLNVAPTYTLRDIADNFRRLDSVFLQGTMTRHSSGLELLAARAPMPGEPALDLDGAKTRAILDLMQSLRDVTLIDTAHYLSEPTQAALLCASRILLIADLSIPTLRGCLRTLEWLKEEGVELTSRVEVVINKHTGKAFEIPPDEISKALKLPVRAILPRDDATALAAINNGVPIHDIRGGSPLDRAIADLAMASTQVTDSNAKRKGFLRLFSAAEKTA